MLSIPLPFVVSLLLSVLAASLWLQRQKSAHFAAGFLLMCALTTAIVGLRWTFDVALFRILQPIMASLIPVMAWWVFNYSKHQIALSRWHFLAPCLVAIGALSYPLWQPPIDILITLQYVFYGVALWRASSVSNYPPEFIRISEWHGAVRSGRIAAGMLLFSALIDGVLSLDFILFDGQHAVGILSIGHAVLLPTLALAVVGLSFITKDEPTANESVKVKQPTHSDEPATESEVHNDPAAATLKDSQQTLEDSQQTFEESQQTLNRVLSVLQDQRMFLDPDLTLARLARKSGIPARRISAAINQVTQQNVSQWVNSFRIEHAQHLLSETDRPITDIFLESGFQTKSNFHREFSRITGMTPSAYRAKQKS